MTAAPQIGRTYSISNRRHSAGVDSGARYRVVWNEWLDGRHVVGAVRVMAPDEGPEERFVVQEFEWFAEETGTS
jgi:hypothetical protein